MPFKAVIVAAGSGRRAGGPKHWTILGGKPVMAWSVEAMLAAGATYVVVVVAENDLDKARTFCLQHFPGDITDVITGGQARSESVWKGLQAIEARSQTEDLVLIHDSARPLLEANFIIKLIDELKVKRAVVPALPSVDSLKSVVAGKIVDAPSRERIWRAQTPQAFRLGDIIAAYKYWPAGDEATDEAQIAGHYGLDIHIVEGSPRLLKYTTPEDLLILNALINENKPMFKIIKTGNGFDAHRLGPGTSLWLCGVEIPHERTLIGHSDADAGLHALVDALLGGCALGDIGDHFPPSEERWKGAASHRFVRFARDLVKQVGGEILNVDITLICEVPRIKPYRSQMRQAVADMLEISVDQVSIKATTTEGMGFAGRKEGIAAMACCSIGFIK